MSQETDTFNIIIITAVITIMMIIIFRIKIMMRALYLNTFEENY